MKEKLQSSKRQLDRNQDYLMQNFLRGLFYRDITGTREELEKVVKPEVFLLRWMSVIIFVW